MLSRGSERASPTAAPVATATGDCGTQDGIGQGVAAAACVGSFHILRMTQHPGSSGRP